MRDLLEQFSILDALLNNWDGIQIRLGPEGKSLSKEMIVIAEKLSSVVSPDAIALLLEDLLDLVEETPAYSYVKELIARAKIDETECKTRSKFATASSKPEHAATVSQATIASGIDLGRTIAGETSPCQVEVYFATNRTTTTKEKGYFTGEHQESIIYGNASVTIPVSRHRIGQVEQRPWWQFFYDKNDPRRYMVLNEIETLEQGAFSQKLIADTNTASDLLVFLHGYNVTFEEAARRAAQFAYDMEFKGRIILYSWPSLGRTMGYPADEERAFLAADCFNRFLNGLEEGPWAKVHVVAHSMGNRVMLLGLAGSNWPNSKLNQIVFVAADVYVEVFEQKFPKIREKAGRYSSYVSRSDRALQISSLLHKARRIGISNGGLYSFDGLETVDASELNTSLLSLGHGYFAEKRSVITDLGNLIRNGLGAASRGLRSSADKKYWLFPK